MAPAWAQFESAYQHKLQIVYINVDERSTKEFQTYSELMPESIPHTAWVTRQNKPVSEKTGVMTFAELKAASDKALATP